MVAGIWVIDLCKNYFPLNKVYQLKSWLLFFMNSNQFVFDKFVNELIKIRLLLSGNLITMLRLPGQNQVSHKPCYHDGTILSLDSRAGQRADSNALAETGRATVDSRLRNAPVADNVNLRCATSCIHGRFILRRRC